MADLEPSLGELTNMKVDPATSGVAPNPVIDNSHIVDTLNQNARFNAENTWKKYQTYLQNKTDLFQNIGAIQGLDTLAEDKPLLNKQAGDIFSDILKNPSVVMGGKGYDELQQKIGAFRSQSMLSKQNNLDTSSDKLFLERNPELQTDDNMKALSNFRNVPLGQRKTVQLQLPTVFDEKSAFEGLLKGATKPYSAIVGKDGKPGEGYIETGNEVNPKSLLQGWQLALDGQKDKYGHSILGAVKDNFNRLPDDQKDQYTEQGGDPVKNYFLDRGQKYLDAYLPKGSYEQTPEGNYRFSKTLKDDPAYLGREKLAEEQRKNAETSNYHKGELAVKWADVGINRDKLNKGKKEDWDGTATVLNEASTVINNGEQVKEVGRDGSEKIHIRISDPNVLKKFSKLDDQGNVVNAPDAMNIDQKTGQVSLIYGKPNKDGGFGTTGHPLKEIKLDQRVWLNTIANDAFSKKDIGGINSNLEKVLQSNGNNIVNIANKFKAQQSQTNAEPSTKTENTKIQSYSVKGKKYSKSDLNKLGYTDDQINQAIKLGTIK